MRLNESKATSRGLTAENWDNLDFNYLWEIKSLLHQPFYLTSLVYLLGSSGYKIELHLQRNNDRMMDLSGPISLHFGVTPSIITNNPLAWPLKLRVQVTLHDKFHQIDFSKEKTTVFQSPVSIEDCSTFVGRYEFMLYKDFLKCCHGSSIDIEVNITKLALN